MSKSIPTSKSEHITPISKIGSGEIFYVSPFSLGRYKTQEGLYRLFLSDNQSASLISQGDFTIPCLCTSVGHTQHFLLRIFSSGKKQPITGRTYKVYGGDITNRLSIAEYNYDELGKEYFGPHTVVNVQDDIIVDTTTQKKTFRRLRNRLYKKEKVLEGAIRKLLHDFFNDVDTISNNKNIINKIDKIIIHLQSQTYNPERLYDLLQQSTTYEIDISDLVAPIMSKYREYKAKSISDPTLLDRIKEDSLDADEYELVAFVETKTESISRKKQQSKA